MIQEFKDLIESNTRIYKHVNAMYEEVPDKKVPGSRCTASEAWWLTATVAALQERPNWE